ELSRFGIVYDRYFFETSLYAGGVIEEMKKQMKEKDLIFEEDGALWFRATRYGDDKDRVLVKKDGESTYFLSDIAYHYEKYRRGYALCINVWGADHHGYVKRLEGAVEALGRGKENFHVVLYQLVRLLRKGEPVVMSTRAGEFVTLEEVMREVGTDVTRFYLLLRKTTSHLDFDLEKAKEESMDNPVYYLQYAHARISSVFQKARERDLSCDFSGADFRNLEDDREKELMKKILFFPDVLVRCGEEKEPYYLVEYLLGLAQVFHNYYNNSRFLEHPDRLALIDGLKYVLASGLSLLGIKPMEKM
ncbi:MAG TPA: arginine--tRNA ligase, partial [bacterium]|nr:arginine--tRNA ligase [bacterium]